MLISSYKYHSADLHWLVVIWYYVLWLIVVCANLSCTQEFRSLKTQRLCSPPMESRQLEPGNLVASTVASTLVLAESSHRTKL